MLGASSLRQRNAIQMKFRWRTDDGPFLVVLPLPPNQLKNQVAQWATISHLGASIMFGDTIKYDAQRQVTLNLKE